LDRPACRNGETDTIHEQGPEGNRVGHGDVLRVLKVMLKTVDTGFVVLCTGNSIGG
jgi:hypothetical protein